MFDVDKRVALYFCILSQLKNNYSLQKKSNTRTWVTSVLASPTSPCTIRTGSVKTSRASRSTRFLNVAENSNVCLSGRTWLQIDLTCGSATRHKRQLMMALHSYCGYMSFSLWCCTSKLVTPLF